MVPNPRTSGWRYLNNLIDFFSLENCLPPHQSPSHLANQSGDLSIAPSHLGDQSGDLSVAPEHLGDQTGDLSASTPSEFFPAFSFHDLNLQEEPDSMAFYSQDHGYQHFQRYHYHKFHYVLYYVLKCLWEIKNLKNFYLRLLNFQRERPNWAGI